MIDIALSIIKNSLSITFFVLSMMLVIEFINVITKGSFSKKIQRNGFQQILFASLLGILPGCFGAYTIVTLYTHNLVSFGALVANFIATMGDETFLLYSMIPQKAIFITLILFAIGLTTGLLVDFINKKRNNQPKKPTHFTIHEHESEHAITSNGYKSIITNIKNASPHRALLLFGIIIILVLSIFGEIGHSHDLLSSFTLHDTSHEQCTHDSHETNWLAISFIFLSILMFYIISIVSEHFLEEHFWNHIIKKHFIKIFGWTSLVLVGIHFLNEYVHIQEFISTYQYHILIIAILVGIIPESGPHVIFLSLYVSGAIPLSILLANSIVQDGHGALPLFAESKKDFLKVKLVNVIVAFIVGFVGLQFNL